MLRLGDKEFVKMSEADYTEFEIQWRTREINEVYLEKIDVLQEFVDSLPTMIQKVLKPALQKYIENENEAQLDEVCDMIEQLESYVQKSTETDALTQALFAVIEQNKKYVDCGILPDFDFTLYSTMSLLNIQHRLEQHPRSGVEGALALLLVNRELQFRNNL